jgi:hypothetical protein
VMSVGITAACRELDYDPMSAFDPKRTWRVARLGIANDNSRSKNVIFFSYPM